MTSVINTNIASLNAQRNLNTSQAGLQTSLQRLSSGLRINSAKDDAAGLAISQRMTSQINGMNQAVRNANDGISLSQTAEGAMGTVGDNLQRIHDLSVQSSNATNNDTDRAAIQKEVSQLKTEIDRVASQTSFNGTKIMDGSFTGAVFQVGANAGETITVGNVTDVRTQSLGSTKFADATSSALTKASATSGMKINGIDIEDVAASTATGATADADQANKIAAAINAKYDQTGVYATVDSSNKMTLSSTKADGDMKITSGVGGLADTTAATTVTMNDANVKTFVDSQRAISVASKALNTINDGRADLGAIQNRFTSAISNLQTSSENLSAARSRITDTDFASETANMTRNQILQQAGTAMLAQANQLPNSVMSLLR